MSHITKIETQIADLDAVEQALVELGLDVSRGAEMAGWGARTGAFHLACLRLPGCAGLLFNAGSTPTKPS